MPLDGNGVASKPAGTTAVPNTKVESAKFNSVVDDIYAIFNTERPVVKGGTGADTPDDARANLGVPGLTDINTFTKIQKWAKGADVASAAELTLGDDGNYFDITGSNAITSIASKGIGTVVKLHFDASPPLTHSADLVLPDGTNITPGAGDEAEFIEYATGDWRCTGYLRATTPPPLPGWEDVGIFNPSAQGSLDITGLSAYSMLRVEGYLVPTTDATQLGLRTSTNNGSSFDGGASDYSWTGHFSNGSSVATSTDADDTWISLSVGNANIGNVTTEGVHLDLLMTRFNASNHMILSGVVTVIRDNGSVMPMQVGGKRLSTSARDAFQFRFNTGNIAIGKISVRGLRG